MKVAVSGGPAQTLCDAPGAWDGSWGSEGTILFDGAGSDPIRRVSAAGGLASPAMPKDSTSVGWPAAAGRWWCSFRPWFSRTTPLPTIK